MSEENQETQETQETQKTPKTLTEIIKENNLQDELNTLMADNRRKLTKQNTDLIKQLESFKNAANTTQQQRDELQARIEQLEVQYLSKEELTKREQQKEQKKYQQELEKLSSEASGWKNLYSTETIDRALQNAAIEGKAVHPGQIVEILKNKTKLAEVIEDGQPTGRYAPVVQLEDVTEDGKPVVLEMSPSDAIKRMREIPTNHNLFEGTSSSGFGESGGVGGNKSQQSLDALKDPANYVKWRKENPDLDISSFRR